MSWFSHGCHGQQHCSWTRRHGGDGGDGVPQHGGHTPNNRLTDMQPWFTVYFLDIGHPYYDQLTPVKTRYLLTSIMWPYRGLKCTAHWGHVVFWSWPLTKCWFLIGSQAHVRFTCWKQGRIIRKPVNASPRLKFSRIITFSSILMFFAALFWVYGDCKTQNRKSNSKVNRKTHRKVTKLKLPFPGLAQ